MTYPATKEMTSVPAFTQGDGGERVKVSRDDDVRTLSPKGVSPTGLLFRQARLVANVSQGEDCFQFHNSSGRLLSKFGLCGLLGDWRQEQTYSNIVDR